MLFLPGVPRALDEDELVTDTSLILVSVYSVYSLDEIAGDINFEVVALELRLPAVMRLKSRSMRRNSFFAIGSGCNNKIAYCYMEDCQGQVKARVCLCCGKLSLQETYKLHLTLVESSSASWLVSDGWDACI